MEDCGIYLIENSLNHRVYIGSSISLTSRRNKHFNLLRKNKHSNKYLQNDFNKYGEDNFIFEIVFNTKEDSLGSLEQYYLDMIFDNQVNCYNIQDKVNTPENWKEYREKLSNKCTGRTLSEETKIKMRKPKPEGFGAKLSKVKQGISYPHMFLPHTEETKIKMTKTWAKKRDVLSKVCTKCLMNKPISEFYRKREGTEARCKVCKYKVSKVYALRHKEELI